MVIWHRVMTVEDMMRDVNDGGPKRIVSRTCASARHDQREWWLMLLISWLHIGHGFGVGKQWSYRAVMSAVWCAGLKNCTE